MRVTATKIPALRFPEFEGEWEEKRLGEVALKISDGIHTTPQYDDAGDYFFINGNNLVRGMILLNEKTKRVNKAEYEKHKVVLGENTILLSINGTIGNLAYYNAEKVILGKSACYINLPNEFSKPFIFNILQNHKIQRYFSSEVTGSTIMNLSLATIKSTKINLPTLPEQQKIAAFLTTIDTRIQQLSRKKALLEQYKKEVMKQIFSQAIRFKDENGKEFPAWEEKRLGEIFERVTRKNNEDNQNVLTISAQQGLVSQQDYFNKSVASKDLKGYYLLHKGDFAYNKSYSNGYPLGAIKRLIKYDKGVVSTLYICFKIQPSNSEEYFEQYFESGFLNSEIHKIAQEGARNHGLLNISVVEFFKDIYLPRPSIAEQQKIAAFLSTLDRQINLVSQQLERMQAFKKGLLQQMFV